MMIQAVGIQKNYKGFRLNCSMKLEEGCITGVVGQNGAGKTTLFKAILGLINLDGGELKVFGKDAILELLREYMETDGRSILISSHISSDLEGLCDDIYMIHQGEIVLHEETDALLAKYGLLKVDAQQYEKLDKQYLLCKKKESFGYSCLTNERQCYLRYFLLF